MLAPTPYHILIDQQNRPYFLWDMEMTLDEFERAINDHESPARPYLIGKLMRQAKPDDALQFVSVQEIADLWPLIERYLGRTRPFWAWLLEQWELRGLVKIVDLVAETTDSIEPPTLHSAGSAEILVDSAHVILVEKLCALLERSEVRDLVDVNALLRNGESLELAVDDAARRDRGFSALTLAWVLRDFDVRALASSAGLEETAAVQLDAFRLALIDRLIDAARA